MNICIFVDMEGISGVSGSEFVATDGRLYPEARRFYTLDTNACARGCRKAGARRILVRDGHGAGNHLLVEKLEPGLEVIQGPTPRRLEGIEEFDALILLGYHAMAGTRGALLEHTYSSKAIQNMWLNGKPVGEVGIDAGVAADHGVPTILVTGDDYVCREAADWISGVETCQVKRGLSCQSAWMLPLEEAHQLIEDAAARACSRIGDIPPMALERPVTIRKEVIERGAIPRELPSRDLRIVDGRTVECTRDTVEEAFFCLI